MLYFLWQLPFFATEDMEALTGNLPLTSPSVEELTEQLKPLLNFDKRNEEHLLSSLQTETNIMEKIKQVS